MIGRLLLALALLAGAPAAQAADACELPQTVPEAMQVAWVSPTGQGVGLKGMLNVVRTADLRALVVAEKREPTSLLRAIGLLGRRQKIRRGYKVTLFDVRTEWLCRPSAGAEGEDHAGVARCEAGWQRKGARLRRQSWTGCGYLDDTADGHRSVDVIRIRWRVAIAGGFCVLPLERFIEGV